MESQKPETECVVVAGDDAADSIGDMTPTEQARICDALWDDLCDQATTNIAAFAEARMREEKDWIRGPIRFSDYPRPSGQPHELCFLGMSEEYAVLARGRVSVIRGDPDTAFERRRIRWTETMVAVLLGCRTDGECEVLIDHARLAADRDPNLAEASATFQVLLKQFRVAIALLAKKETAQGDKWIEEYDTHEMTRIHSRGVQAFRFCSLDTNEHGKIDAPLDPSKEGARYSLVHSPDALAELTAPQDKTATCSLLVLPLDSRKWQDARLRLPVGPGFAYCVHKNQFIVVSPTGSIEVYRLPFCKAPVERYEWEPDSIGRRVEQVVANDAVIVVRLGGARVFSVFREQATRDAVGAPATVFMCERVPDREAAGIVPPFEEMLKTAGTFGADSKEAQIEWAQQLLVAHQVARGTDAQRLTTIELDATNPYHCWVGTSNGNAYCTDVRKKDGVADDKGSRDVMFHHAATPIRQIRSSGRHLFLHDGLTGSIQEMRGLVDESAGSFRQRVQGPTKIGYIAPLAWARSGATRFCLESDLYVGLTSPLADGLTKLSKVIAPPEHFLLDPSDVKSRRIKPVPFTECALVATRRSLFIGYPDGSVRRILVPIGGDPALERKETDKKKKKKKKRKPVLKDPVLETVPVVSSAAQEEDWCK